MAEHSSLYGLKVKILSRDMFPTGVVFHEERYLMKRILTGNSDPYMFHMSWTASKKDKVRYFRQMGDWFVHDNCTGKVITNIAVFSKNAKYCCSARPLVSCYYRDKPSIVSCDTSKAQREGSRNFWRQQDLHLLSVASKRVN